MTEHNEHKYRGQDIEQTSRALRYEGKIDKDTLDWFEKEYKKKFRLEEQKRRHESLTSVGALGTLKA